MRDERVLADPQVQGMIAKASNAKTTREALDAHLLLEQFLLGKYSTLSDPAQADRLNAMLVDAESRDKAAAAWERDREGFVDGIFNDAEKKKLSGNKVDEAKAKTAHMMQQAFQGELSNQRLKQAELDHRIATEPMVDVQASGRWVKHGPHDRNTSVLEAERVIIMHREFVFQPGINTNVPKAFADRYEQMTVSRAETAEREQVMGKGSDQNAVAGQTASALEAALRKIDQKYGVKRQLPS